MIIMLGINTRGLPITIALIVITSLFLPPILVVILSPIFIRDEQEYRRSYSY